jgi:hypothetical protein
MQPVALFRPIHFVVSQPKLGRMFGHTPHEAPLGILKRIARRGR